MRTALTTAPAMAWRGIVLSDMTNNGSISQTVAGLTSGTTYRLSFDTHRSGDGLTQSILEVRWNGTVVGTVVTNTQASWITTNMNLVAAAGNNTLTLTEIGTGGNPGWRTYLDNVQLINTPAALSIAENSANATLVDTLSTFDGDTGDSFTYTLTNDAGGRFAINSSTGALTVANGSLLNFEAASSHTIVGSHCGRCRGNL